MRLETRERVVLADVPEGVRRFPAVRWRRLAHEGDANRWTSPRRRRGGPARSTRLPLSPVAGPPRLAYREPAAVSSEAPRGGLWALVLGLRGLGLPQTAPTEPGAVLSRALVVRRLGSRVEPAAVTTTAGGSQTNVPGAGAGQPQ